MLSSAIPDRVLIIDDDVMSREVLVFLLEDEGFVVEAVISGEAALEHLHHKSPLPTVVLADVQLPGISGHALAAALRLACGQDAMLIAMSGSHPSTEMVAAFGDFLLKPFTAADVVSAVERGRQAARGAKTGYNQGVSRSHKGVTDPREASGSEGASNSGMSAQSYQAQAGSPSPGTLPRSINTVLDERVYGQLADTMNGKQLHEMYGLCIRDVRKRITSLRTLAAHGEAEQFERQAHAIKGGCGMLGALELYRMAAVLEKAGLKASGLDGGSGVNPLDELAAACDRLERILGTRT